MSNSAVFADAFNFYIYDGEQVIKPEKLRPLDTSAIASPFSGENGQPVQKLRDVLKYVTAMEDDEAAYLILGIENQTEVHYAMPARNMLYDALEYTHQIEKIAAEHREKKDHKGRSGGEYLSGYYKDDVLVPVITLVVYFGAGKWDGPRSLHEMLGVRSDRVLKYVDNYNINLIAPAELTEEDFDKFRTDFREVMKYIQYSTDKKKLTDLVESDESFTHIDRGTAMLLNECTKSELKFDESKEVIDMCQAIKDIRADERAEGRVEGRVEGRAEGLITAIKSLMESMNFNAKQAMDALKIPEADRAAYLAQI